MKKGIQHMKQFMKEQTTLGLTPATASYDDLSDARGASWKLRLSSTTIIPYRQTEGGLWPPMLLAASDAQWRSGAVWGS
jgi:hypothetical protein